MQKLVSKNPILRFKLGKLILILKMLLGKLVRYKGVIYDLDKDGNFTYVDKNKITRRSNLVKDSSGKLRNLVYKTTSTKTEDKKPVSNQSSSIKTSKPRSGWSYGFGPKEGITDIRATQRMLKELGYYADDENSSDDGKWGQSTENAYLRYLNKLKAMELPPEVVVTPKIEKNITDHPLVQYIPNLGYKTNNTYEGNDFFNRMKSMGIRSNADLIDFMYRNNAEGSTFNGDAWAKQFHSDVNRALGGNYSDANIRKVFGTSGRWGKGFLGRGDFGDFQNALQTNAGIWNGRYNNRLAQNLGWMLLRKQGGQLVSRNPIVRFKQGSSFGKAFREARAAGLKEFEWNGKKYHTRTKEEEEARKKQPSANKKVTVYTPSGKKETTLTDSTENKKPTYTPSDSIKNKKLFVPK